jgi:hypothetical protein
MARISRVAIYVVIALICVVLIAGVAEYIHDKSSHQNSTLLSEPTSVTTTTSSSTTAPTSEDSLTAFLISYVKNTYGDNIGEVKYFNAFVDLAGNGTKEAVVYLAGPEICGSAGCDTLVLMPDGSTYRVVATIGISRPPIEVLPTSSNGWHDLAVWVQGGGIQSGYEAQLRFNGNTYPNNPTISPATPLEGTTPRQIIIPSFSSYQSGQPLLGS